MSEQQRRVAVAIAGLLAVVVGWHLFLALRLGQRVERGGEVSVNPITNLVSLRIDTSLEEADGSDAFASLGAALGEAMVQTIGPGVIERDLNIYARERFDLYAMFIPYRVRISTGSVQGRVNDPDGEEGIVAGSSEDAEARRAGLVREYISSNVTAENVRVAGGESRYGERVEGVFGTVVNHGDRTLDQVRMRIYFLDRSGRRIGEHEFFAVLSGESLLGERKPPLRPGYRSDFGSNIGDHAPSGWAKEIELEVIEIRFAEQ